MTQVKNLYFKNLTNVYLLQIVKLLEVIILSFTNYNMST